MNASVLCYDMYRKINPFGASEYITHKYFIRFILKEVYFLQNIVSS